MLSSNEPKDCRVHEAKHRCCSVKHVEVPLFPLARHILGQRHSLDDRPLESTLDLIGLRVVQVGEGPGLSTVMLVQGRSIFVSWAEDTHKRNDMVRQGQDGTKYPEVKQTGHEASFRFFHIHLVVASHDGRCRQVCQDDATENDQEVLGYPSPRRMAGSKKNGLHKASLGPRCSQLTVRVTYMVLHDDRRREALVPKKRSGRHFESASRTTMFHEKTQKSEK